MSKNRNSKKDIIMRNNWSEIISAIHIPANSSITTKLGSLISIPSSSKFIFNEMKPRNNIGTRSKSLKIKSIFSPMKKIIKQGNKLQKVPEPIFI